MGENTLGGSTTPWECERVSGSRRSLRSECKYTGMT